MMYPKEKTKLSRPLQLIGISLYVLLSFIFMNCDDQMYRVSDTMYLIAIPIPRSSPPEDPNENQNPPPPEPKPVREKVFNLVKYSRLKEEQKWECDTCTFENPNGTRICEACNTVHLNVGEWTCRKCTYINETDTIDICQTCGADMPYPFDSDSDDENEAAEKISCPICLDEFEGNLPDPYACGQCKKEVCGPCYQDFKQSKNTTCPICRYNQYITP